MKVEYSTVEKSDYDDRTYRAFVLENGVRCVVVHDGTATRCAAACSVRVGSHADPDGICGLAHFCEHMLFLGTEKYPEENSFGAFLNNNGGSSNAYTGDETNYHFVVDTNVAEEALDRFSSFFTCPLFNSDAVDREVMAVDSEHQKNTQHDYWRTRSTLRALARNNHVQSKFTTGDRCTLKEVTEANGKSVRDELLKFHKKYYRPDMMSVAVISSHSLDVLERSVTSLFGSIPRADSAVIAKAEAIPEPVLTADYTDVFHSRYLMSKVDTEGLGVAGPEIKLLHEIIDRQDAVPHHPRSFINAIPLQEVRSLNISFAMPPVGSSYTKQVHHFFGHLIGHEGPGSLLSYLKSQSLANSLSAGLSHDGDDLGMMSVTMDLTPEGEANIDEVIAMVFGYIAMLSKASDSMPSYVYDDAARENELGFIYKSKLSEYDLVRQLAQAANEYPLSHVLTYGLVKEHDYQNLYKLLLTQYLTVDNAIIMHVSHVHEDNETVKLKERWHGQMFGVRVVDDAIVKQWMNAGESHAQHFHLPDRNDFLPRDLTVLSTDSYWKDDTVPQLIYDDGYHVYYRKDNKYNRPKSLIYALVRSDQCSSSPLMDVAGQMFAMLVQDYLSEYSYAADLAGHKYSFTTSMFGFELKLNGYSDGEMPLLERIMDTISHFTVRPDRFVVMKELLHRSFLSSLMDQPYRQCMDNCALFYSDKVWSKPDNLKALESLDEAVLAKCVCRFFDKVHIDVLVSGNATRQQAIKMASLFHDSIVQSYGSMEVREEELYRVRALSMPLVPTDAMSTLKLTSKCCDTSLSLNHADVSPPIAYIVDGMDANPASVNHACVAIFELEASEIKTCVLGKLFAVAIEEDVFDNLRTKKQLGYIVSGQFFKSSIGTCGLMIIVQSARFDANSIYHHIETYARALCDNIKSMTDSQFESFKQSLMVKLADKDKTLVKEADRAWFEVMSRRYQFDRQSHEVNVLTDISKSDLVQFFDSYISLESSTRRLFISRVFKGDGSQQLQHSQCECCDDECECGHDECECGHDEHDHEGHAVVDDSVTCNGRYCHLSLHNYLAIRRVLPSRATEECVCMPQLNQNL